MCNNRRPPPQPRPKEKDPAAATSARQSPQRSHEAPRSHTKTKQAGRNLLDPRRLFAPHQACSSAVPRFPASAHAFRGPLSLGTPLQHPSAPGGEGGPGCPGQSGPSSSKRRPVCVLNE